MKFIVEFPAEWYMRVSGKFALSTGGIERATRFESAEAAKAALVAFKKFFKAPAVKAARIVEVEA
jgi:hypothetical protein